MPGGRRRLKLLIAAACLVALAALPETAGAVLSGTNGRIAFVSGRGATAGNDLSADLYLRPAFGGIGAGSPSLVTTATGTQMHRHPTWSPDRTMIAYAHGDNSGSPGAANFDIFILDLTDPNATPQNVTNSNSITDDRPAWSPDGTRIAFESENSDTGNPPTQLNIKIYNLATGNISNFTSTTNNTFEHKPAWTPDSQTLYYVTGSPSGTDTMDIVRQPADGSAGPSDVVADPNFNDFQPSISPDGTQMCFTRGDGAGFNSTARVWVALANGGAQDDLPGGSGVAGYNCTWSPDGTLIAYVQGTFTSGDLWIESSDKSLNTFLSLETTASHFDGNPDWAPDGRPRCRDRRVFTRPNTPVTIPLACPDTGPAYEQTPVMIDVANDLLPEHGTVSPIDPQPAPASVTYVPNGGFRGRDSFTVRGFDQVAFGDRRGVITVNVGPPCAGRRLTKIGSPGPDILRGTRRRDVIAGLGGNDVIRGLGRGDVLCGGRGRDRLIGGGGRDRIFGGPGRDILKGGKGTDKLRGGPGLDVEIQ